MDKKKVLIITHEMDPYVNLTSQAELARQLPQHLQEHELEVRVFMPRFGKINERKHRLHEVIRLSGINVPVGEDDNPMIIKVASLPAAKMQVYFIDNEDLFHRKFYLTDKEGKFFPDNDERTIFFNKGAIEILLKLGWLPDVIHCHGWMTSLIPYLAKTKYKGEPAFKNSKMIYTPYNGSFEGSLGSGFLDKAHLNDSASDEVQSLLKDPTSNDLYSLGIEYADAVSIGSPDLSDDLKKKALESDKPHLDYIGPEDEGFGDKYYDLYKSVLDES